MPHTLTSTIVPDDRGADNGAHNAMRAQADIEGSRIAYPSEAMPGADNIPDVGIAHAGIHAMKAYINELEMKLLLTRLSTDATTDAKRTVLPLFAGAVYDFAGFLTTRNHTIEVGSAANASGMIDLIKEWANLRGLDMATADINAWLGLLSAVRQDTPTDSRV